MLFPEQVRKLLNEQTAIGTGIRGIETTRLVHRDHPPGTESGG